MTITAKSLSALALLLLLPAAGSAQQDAFGAIDTVWAEIAKIDSLNWSVNLSYFNDEAVVGMSIPLKLSAGLNRIIADSCISAGGRVEEFDIRAFRADTAIQCVTLGMIASLSGKRKCLLPGKGRLATIFISSIDDKPIEKLTVDTTTTHPHNSLEVIADSVQGEKSDTTRITDMSMRTIIPIFLTVYPE